MDLIGVQEIITGIETAAPQMAELMILYGSLPETGCHCDRPGECCVFLPQMTWMEALQWFRCLLELPEAEREAMVRKFLRFFLTNPARSGHCPFLAENGGSGNYAFRPFACRAYGMWSLKWGRERTEESREGKKALVAMWRRYGIELPEERVIHEIDYCDRMSVLGKEVPSDARLMKHLSRIHRLDDAQPELKRRFEDEFQSDFSALMAALVWGPLKANLNKYAVIKEMVQKGADDRLNKLLNKAKPPF